MELLPRPDSSRVSRSSDDTVGETGSGVGETRGFWRRFEWRCGLGGRWGYVLVGREGPDDTDAEVEGVEGEGVRGYDPEEPSPCDGVSNVEADSFRSGLNSSRDEGEVVPEVKPRPTPCVSCCSSRTRVHSHRHISSLMRGPVPVLPSPSSVIPALATR